MISGKRGCLVGIFQAPSFSYWVVSLDMNFLRNSDFSHWAHKKLNFLESGQRQPSFFVRSHCSRLSQRNITCSPMLGVFPDVIVRGQKVGQPCGSVLIHRTIPATLICSSSFLGLLVGLRITLWVAILIESPPSAKVKRGHCMNPDRVPHFKGAQVRRARLLIKAGSAYLKFERKVGELRRLSPNRQEAKRAAPPRIKTGAPCRSERRPAAKKWALGCCRGFEHRSASVGGLDWI